MDEPEDTALAAERDSKLAAVGFKPSLERVTKVYGEGYEVSTAPAATPVAGDGAATDQPDESAGKAAQKYDASMINAYSMGIDRFSKLGMEVPENFVRGLFGIPIPKNGERVLLAPVADTAPPAEFADPIPEDDTPATQADRLAADSANAMTDLIAEVGKMVAAAASIEDLQRGLVNAYGHLDTEELTRIMALGFAAAELAGMMEASGE